MSNSNGSMNHNISLPLTTITIVHNTPEQTWTIAGGQSSWQSAWNNANGVNHSPAGDVSFSQQRFQILSVPIVCQTNNVELQPITSHGEDIESSDEEDDLEGQLILKNTFAKYSLEASVDGEKVSKIVTEVCQSGATVCLICISSVKRNHSIWNCVLCFSMYHLRCIQGWANEDINQEFRKLERNVFKKDLKWDCPKCRYKYNFDDIPNVYLCYCGKVENPVSDPWHIPHSCGRLCEKILKPSTCGHRCNLMCHPGPCPPCPQIVEASCYCGNSKSKPIRCSKRDWACHEKCGKKLSCKKHQCSAICHQGNCPPCNKIEKQQCRCGRNSQVRLCSSERWQCDELCGALYPCDVHTCEKICHEGECGDCPTSGERTCPCGNTKHSNLACTESVPTCLNTCERLLSCNLHYCQERCHNRECPQCIERVQKSCRCKARSKLVQCTQNFTCEVKCQKMRNCGRHQCKRKCCVDCPPCELICNKILNCGNHKCGATCHPGLCYPCQQMKTLQCACKAASMEVPCGRERNTKPPKCNQLCKKKPSCHHETQRPHKCHFKHCPPCQQQCGKPLENCNHSCLAFCHSAVWTRSQLKPFSNEPVHFVQMEQPCPQCKTIVEMSCFGKHENIEIQCAKAKPYSCGMSCGRILACGNHVCERCCHVVINALDDVSAGEDCEVCEKGCERERPPDCNHFCPLPCHEDDCPPCITKVSRRCRCGHLSLLIVCTEWTNATSSRRNELLDGNHPCPKVLSCGHVCTRDCHAGSCLPDNECIKKTLIKCPCGRVKQEHPCNASQNIFLSCDEICSERQAKKQRKQRERLEAAQLLQQTTQLEIQNEQSLAPRCNLKHKPKKQSPIKFIRDEKRKKSKTFANRSFFIPVLLAFLTIFVGLYISIAAELK